MLSIENGVLGRSSRKKKTVTNPSVTHFCLCLGKKGWNIQKNWGQGRSFLFFSSFPWLFFHALLVGQMQTVFSQCCLPHWSVTGLSIFHIKNKIKYDKLFRTPFWLEGLSCRTICHSHFSTFRCFSVSKYFVFLFSAASYDACLECGESVFFLAHCRSAKKEFSPAVADGLLRFVTTSRAKLNAATFGYVLGAVNKWVTFGSKKEATFPLACTHHALSNPLQRPLIVVLYRTKFEKENDSKNKIEEEIESMTAAILMTSTCQHEWNTCWTEPVFLARGLNRISMAKWKLKRSVYLVVVQETVRSRSPRESLASGFTHLKRKHR